MAIVSADIRSNWVALSKDPIVIEMANDFAYGVEHGLTTREELPKISALATNTYRDAGGTIDPLTIGAVVQAIAIVLGYPED